jgi:ABC-2 type transport system ATP-binding protein
LPSTSEPGVIRAADLGRRFELRDAYSRSLKDLLLRKPRPPRRELWALRHVDLAISPGETFGIVGRNGSGKSTLLKLLAGIFGPSEGTLEVQGRVGSLLEVGAGFHPEFTGTENVYLNASVFGIPHAYVDEHIAEIIEFAELEQFADQPVKTYSSGMYTRLGFSVAMHIEPNVLLLDEVLAVGDESFQQKCFGKIFEFKHRGGTIVFVSHDPSAVERLCDRAILLDHGQVEMAGTAEEVLLAYHRALTNRPAPAVKPTLTAGFGAVTIELVQSVGADGLTRDAFLERESACFVIILSATDPTVARVTVTIRDQAGQALTVATHPAVDIAHRPTSIKLHSHPLPVREGRFHLDLRVEAYDGSRTLAEAEHAAEFGVFPNDPAGGGPVFWNTAWELPAAAATPEPTATAD